MVRRVVAALVVLPVLWSAASAIALAQRSEAPVPFDPGAAPLRSIAPEPLPPLPSAAGPAGPAEAISPRAKSPPVAPPRMPAPASMSAPTGAPAERVFCEQAVTVRLADRDAVAERYRAFIGIWSDASWSPQLCAALIVADVTPDGTATIVYVFGPMGSNGRGTGGILHGTGIIRSGELRFQNSDGSQFAFRRLYGDLDGSLATSRGQRFRAVFKKTP